MRGRKPKPIEQQIAEGDPRKKGVRKLQESLRSQPKVSGDLPVCPDYLEGYARQEYDRLCADLEQIGQNKSCFGAMVIATALCLAAVREQAEAGNPCKMEHLKTIRSLASELCLTPASFGKLPALPPDTAKEDLESEIAGPYEPAKVVQ